MNPLSNVRMIKELSERETKLGITGKASWHNDYKDSAWIFIGGLPFDLTEGDIIIVFSQYGEIVNINLVREKKTGKSKGFCFLCYEDQRSTILAVDNLNSIKILGRTVRVDHVANYRMPKEHPDTDEATLKLHKEGCAPPVSEEKKEKMEHKKKKTKKNKKKKERTDSSSSDISQDERDRVVVKQEKFDSGYDRYERAANLSRNRLHSESRSIEYVSSERSQYKNSKEKTSRNSYKNRKEQDERPSESKHKRQKSSSPHYFNISDKRPVSDRTSSDRASIRGPTSKRSKYNPSGDKLQSHNQDRHRSNQSSPDDERKKARNLAKEARHGSRRSPAHERSKRSPCHSPNVRRMPSRTRNVEKRHSCSPESHSSPRNGSTQIDRMPDVRKSKHIRELTPIKKKRYSTSPYRSTRNDSPSLNRLRNKHSPSPSRRHPASHSPKRKRRSSSSSS